MKIAVLSFPGSGGVKDAQHAFGRVLKQEVVLVRHDEETLGEPDLVVLPGGASFADSLRPGALAKECPVIPKVRRFADIGGAVLALGNGFQILCEAGILPGVFLINPSLQYSGEKVHVLLRNKRSPLLESLKAGSIFELALGCTYGCFWADKRTLFDMEESNQVAFCYCDAEGEVDLVDPHNGSTGAIAGVTNRAGNVLGLMPHPERAVEKLLGSEEGLPILRSVLGGAEKIGKRRG